MGFAGVSLKVQETSEAESRPDTGSLDRAGLIALLEQRDREIRGLRARVLAGKRESDGLRHQLEEVRGKLGAIHRSSSWRITAPLRTAKRLLHIVPALFRLYRKRVHRITLEPQNHLEAKGDRYRSTGEDPQFRLVSDRRSLPRSWVVITFEVEDASPTLNPILYIDDGSGTSERAAVRLQSIRQGQVRQLLRLPPRVRGLRLDPIDLPGVFGIRDFRITEIGKLQIFREGLRDLPGGFLGFVRLFLDRGRDAAVAKLLQPLLDSTGADYQTWIELHDRLSDDDRTAIRAHIDQLQQRPLISIVMLTYRSDLDYLGAAIGSVRAQLYENWELCIADDASGDPALRQALEAYAAEEPRIRVAFRDENGHISAASNTALSLARGEYVALMDHDDILAEHALYLVAAEIAAHSEVDVIYSDEDKIDSKGRRHEPYFKSDWNPDLFYSQNVISHLGVYRRSLLEDVGGFRLGLEGSQDYDLALRAIERVPDTHIRHLPYVLYHWRVFEESGSFSTRFKSRAVDTARKALTEYFQRTGEAVEIEAAPGAEQYQRVVRPVPDPLPRVSLIIPTRDRVSLLRGCVEGLRHATDYDNLEIIVVDNDSSEADTLAYFDEISADPRVRVLKYAGAFNFSAINNFAVEQAEGEIVGLINNDIEVIDPNWLREMVAHAVRPEVGAVGAKLYYADDRIQHGGVVIGMGGVAGHIFRFLPRSDGGYFGRLLVVHDVSCVTAACLVMRRELYQEVGGLDAANLAVAFNDVDLCLKLRELGYLIVWTPHAELYHLESASRGSDHAPDQIERFMRETRYMEAHWGDALKFDPYHNPNLTDSAEKFGFAFPPRLTYPWAEYKSEA